MVLWKIVTGNKCSSLYSRELSMYRSGRTISQKYIPDLYLQIMEEIKDEQHLFASGFNVVQPITLCLTTAKSFLARTFGLLSLRMILLLSVWYAFSFAAIFLSKYILDNLDVDLLVFSAIQLLVAAVLGVINMRVHCFMYQSSGHATKKDSNVKSTGFYRVMFFVGSMRFLVVFLGLVSLKYVAVSFTETIKSSAPLFTVIISRLMLKEKNGVFVQLSLIPIMLGLVLCSIYEISFTWIGFYAALGTNVAECLQFVASKLSLSHDHYRLNPAEFQLYTCSAGLAADFLLSLFMPHSALQFTTKSVLLMLLNGLLYHFQTMMAWILMEFLSPVTHSVCNTVKCALAVWISIPLFGNHITLFSGVGTCVVISGVLLYNKARNFEHDLALAGSMPDRDAIVSDHATLEAAIFMDEHVAVELKTNEDVTFPVEYPDKMVVLEN